MPVSLGKQAAEPDDARFCRLYGKQLLTGLLTFDEYAEKMTAALVEAREGLVSRCVDTIPPEALHRYAGYLRAKLVPVDFMPHPFIFFVDKDTDTERERIRRQRRPRYVEIDAAVLARLPAGGRDGATTGVPG